MGELLLQQITDLLLEAGYVRAQNAELSPLDTVIGGFAWCISSIQSPKNFHIVYHENASLGEKLKVGEEIEHALKAMGCPFPLRAHQLRGLDQAPIHKAMVWLLHQLSKQRSTNSLLDSEELNKFPSQTLSYDGPKNEIMTRKNSFNDASPANRLPKLKDKLSSNKKLTELREKIVQQKKNLKDSEVKKEEFISENKNLLERIETKKKETNKLNKKIEKIKKNLKEFEKENEFDSSFFFNVVHNFRQIEDLDREEKELHVQRNEIKSQLQNLISPSNNSNAKNENQSNEELKMVKELRKGIEEKEKKVFELKLRNRNRPSHSELLQYERRIIELFELIQKKHIVTKSLFSSYNFICDIEKYTNKEVSLLNSIHGKMKVAFSSNQSKSDFKNSIQALFASINLSLQTAQKRLNEMQDSQRIAQNEKESIEKRKAQYFSLLQQIEDEIQIGENLRKQKQQTKENK